jgi:multidrug efflux pump subunit AcrA (membrane-fusion protein)
MKTIPNFSLFLSICLGKPISRPIKWFLLLLTAFFCFSCSNNKNGNTKNTKLTGKVERVDLVQRVTIAGTIAPIRTTNIAPPYTGYVKKLYVKVGDKVKTGQPIVSVAQSLLGAQPVFPMQSPLNGYVVQINRAEGEYVRESDNRDYILRIDDTSKFIVKADTPEIDRTKVKVGQTAVIKVNAIIGKTYEGIIRTVASAPTVRDSWRSSTVDYATVVEMTNPDENIHSGMTTLIDLIVAKRDKALSLRHEFIQRDKDGYFVIRTNGDRQAIKVGLQNEEAFEIISGLNENDEVRAVDFASLAETR